MSGKPKYDRPALAAEYRAAFRRVHGYEPTVGFAGTSHMQVTTAGGRMPNNIPLASVPGIIDRLKARAEGLPK